MKTARLRNLLQDSSFPSFVMLVLLIIVNAILQPGFFSYQVFRINFMTFTPLILVSLAQARGVYRVALDPATLEIDSERTEKQRSSA